MSKRKLNVKVTQTKLDGNAIYNNSKISCSGLYYSECIESF